MIDGDHIYDLAVSFADEQRPYVERVVRACEAHGLRVFYDRNKTVDFWGRNFIREFRAVYGGTQARHFVPFLSADYLVKPYPMDEFNAAILQALERGNDDYFLPVMMGPVQVPANLLSPAIGFLRAEDHSAENLAEIIVRRARNAQQQRQEPRDVTEVVEEALQVRLPRIAPTSFSPCDTLETTLMRVGERFKQESAQLEPYGLNCRARTSESSVDVRVEDRGQQICGLRVRFDDSFGDDKLAVSFGWPRITSNGMNGWATAAWDSATSQAKLKYTDFARTINGRGDALISADEFFEVLWTKIVDFIEQRVR